MSCNQIENPTQASQSQYVVLATVPDSANPNCWFEVVNIKTNVSKCVFAVKEIGGTYYLPITNRTPTFNRKVVEGNFFADSLAGMANRDTLFAVTKMLRDTVGNLPH